MTTEPNAPRPDEPLVYHVTADESPSETVIRAVLDASDPDSTSETLPRLYDALDPDALDRLIERPTTGTSPSIRFYYSGYQVTVDAGGRVQLAEA